LEVTEAKQGLEGAPLRLLQRALGPWLTLAVVGGVVRRRLMERPFASLGPATTRRERQSRNQALGAVLLYRELKVRVGADRAKEIAFLVIEAGAVAHLRKTLGRLNGETLARMTPERRLSKVRDWIDRFFTATARIDGVSQTQVSFTVTACALVRLSRAAGHPELAAAFCRGDAAYFASLTPPIDLERRTTLADGHAACPFVLSLRKDEGTEPTELDD
jgi:hypothetical protein